MRFRPICIIAAVAFIAAGCGGGSGGDQDEAADLFLDAGAALDLDLDEDCVRDLTARLSDQDAAAIVESGQTGEPDLSDEGDAIADEIFGCVDVDSYLDREIRSFTDNDDSIDPDCLRRELEGLATAAEIADSLIDAAIACSD